MKTKGFRSYDCLKDKYIFMESELLLAESEGAKGEKKKKEKKRCAQNRRCSVYQLSLGVSVTRRKDFFNECSPQKVNGGKN